jgi:hypothetical protein
MIMKKILIFIVLVNCILFASDQDSSEKRLKKQIEKELENEKKYALEQKFYTEENYDFKGSEVNEESLDSIEVIKEDEDMYSSDFMDMPN